jgi:hypothetical protein
MTAPIALLQLGVPYQITIHYLPATVTADDGKTLTVPQELAQWSGTVTISGSANGYRLGVLAIKGRNDEAVIREQVRLHAIGDSSIMAMEGTSYELVKLPAGSDYVFQLDDFEFGYDGESSAWVCRNHRNAAGVLVDARFIRPTP